MTDSTRRLLAAINSNKYFDWYGRLSNCFSAIGSSTVSARGRLRDNSTNLFTNSDRYGRQSVSSWVVKFQLHKSEFNFWHIFGRPTIILEVKLFLTFSAFSSTIRRVVGVALLVFTASDTDCSMEAIAGSVILKQMNVVSKWSIHSTPQFKLYALTMDFCKIIHQWFVQQSINLAHFTPLWLRITSKVNKQFGLIAIA